MYSFEWDSHKEELNIKKHGISFDDALAVFADPYHITKQDRYENGEYRWQTVGMVRDQLLLLVAHTVHDDLMGVSIRIISARKLTKKERKAYENYSIKKNYSQG